MRCKLIGLALAATFLLSPAVRASEIPLGTNGGIYTVPVTVNGALTMQFLVDPGAGVVVIPLAVLRSLVGSGTVTTGDIIGIGAAELADKSLYLTAKVRLHELRIGDAIVRDVTAAVAPGLGEPLLGQTFLQRFASVTFDNRRHVMILSNDGSAPSAQYPATAWTSPYPSYPYPSYPPPAFTGSSYPPYSYGPGAGR